MQIRKSMTKAAQTPLKPFSPEWSAAIRYIDEIGRYFDYSPRELAKATALKWGMRGALAGAGATGGALGGALYTKLNSKFRKKTLGDLLLNDKGEMSSNVRRGALIGGIGTPLGAYIANYVNTARLSPSDMAAVATVAKPSKLMLTLNKYLGGSKLPGKAAVIGAGLSPIALGILISKKLKRKKSMTRKILDKIPL